MTKIAVGTVHAGFLLKDAIMESLQKRAGQCLTRQQRKRCGGLRGGQQDCRHSGGALAMTAIQPAREWSMTT